MRASVSQSSRIGRRAVLGLLLFSCLLALALPAAGQDTATDTATDAASDAERIARMRDLAGQTQAGGGDQAAAGQADPSGDEATGVGEAGTNAAGLSANEALPLGGASSEGGGLSFFNSGGSDSPSGGAGGDNWVLSTLAALGVVIGLVFAIRWALRRGGVVTSAAPKGSVVEVLSRTTVAPRSHIVLMRVGQRILVVSDSAAGMRTLAQVSEPEEVAELLGAVDASSPSSMSENFSGVMKKLSGQWSDDDMQADGDSLGDDVSLERTRGSLSSVRGRLAMLSKSGGVA